MKQKSFKILKINEKFNNNESKIFDLNNNNTFKHNSSISDINNLFVNKNSSIKNLSLKIKLMQFLTNREKNIKTVKNKDNNFYKKFESDNKNKEINQKSRNILNITEIENSMNEKGKNKEYIPKYNNINTNRNKIFLLKDNIKINIDKTITPIRASKIIWKVKNSRNIDINNKTPLKSYNKNNINSQTISDINYKKLDSNLKQKKGYILKKDNQNSKEINNQFRDLEKERNFTFNKLKNKIRKIKIDGSDTFINKKKNDFKNKSNIILLNIKDYKKNRFIKENKTPTSSEYQESSKKGVLKILELFKKRKNEKIILKQKEKELKDKINNIKNISKLNNENNNKSIINIVKEINNCDLQKENKKHYKSRNIFNEIIEEVQEEKSYVHKIVHKKLIEGIRELKKYNSVNKFNNRSNILTSKDLSLKTLDSLNSDYYNFADNNNEKHNTNLNIPSNINLSEKKELQKNNYFDMNNKNQEFEYMNFENFQTFNNYKPNDNILIDNKSKTNEKHEVKIKKIKLDKLKNKLKRNNLHLYNGDNININLNVNNKTININNSQRIYAPKKGIIAKRSIENMSLNSSLTPYYKINSPAHYLYSKNTNNSNSEYYKSIKPFSEISTFEIEPNKNNVISRNINNNFNNNIRVNTDDNRNEKIKSILYNKAKIKKRADTEYHKYLTAYRSKTIKYIKKRKNKIEKFDDMTKANTNKITKTHEMHIKGLTENISKKIINNFEKVEQINFNLHSSVMHPNNSTKDKNTSYLSTEISNIKLNTLIEQNPNSYKININNGDIHDYNYSNKKSKKRIIEKRLEKNFDKKNNIIEKVDISHENNEINLEEILNMLNLEDLLIIEDKFNLILIVLEKGNKTNEEYLDLLNYFFTSSLRTKIEQIFEYFPKQIELIRAFINYSLIFIIICYDFVINSISTDIDNDFSLYNIAHIIYINILIAINSIKSKIMLDGKDNYSIRLIELSKIEITIKNKLSNLGNDFSFSEKILINNANLLVNRISSLIEANKKNKILNQKYNYKIFLKLKAVSFKEIDNFFRDNILKEDFLGCSVLASTYLKSKPVLTPLIEPFLHVPNKKKYSLVLDLDETLIHFKVNQSEDGEGMLKLRPGVFSFLEKIREFYEIILFTEASEAYAKLMIEAFNKNKKYFDFKLYRQHTMIIENDFVKDLSKLGRPMDKIIIIDNFPQNFKLQKNNGIVIKPFLGENKNDQALEDLIPILINIAKDEIDVRNGLVKYRDEILTKISSNLFRRNKHK